MPKSNTDKLVLTVSAPGAAGQVAEVTGFLYRSGCYIDEFACFDDESNGRFFVRCVFHQISNQPKSREALMDAFRPVAELFAMEWAIHDMNVRPKVLIMVSKLDHCLRDILYRWRINELPIDIQAVVSNHRDLEEMVVAEGIPFYFLPVIEASKPEREAQLLNLIESFEIELVVLARYMQVLSESMCGRLFGRVINIHHSFLPGFKGAKPYHQAHLRGVKLIGATAHYVTTDLDEGPIIEQVVERVDHAHKAEQLLAVGRDMECLALARAVKYHTEHRVFLNESRTVVLR